MSTGYGYMNSIHSYRLVRPMKFKHFVEVQPIIARGSVACMVTPRSCPQILHEGSAFTLQRTKGQTFLIDRTWLGYNRILLVHFACFCL